MNQQIQESEQQPLALLNGETITEIPRDLYIPPEALRVFLETFQGPLDLLLYFIKKQNIDILDIPIAKITAQYIEYIDLMQDMKLELAAEYLVMAAMLAEIKSRILLPRPQGVEEDEDDPRAELIRRLQEYERFKKAAEDLNSLPRYERDIFPAHAEVNIEKTEQPPPDVMMDELILAFKDVMSRAKLMISHQVEREPLSVRERMSIILHQLQGNSFLEFTKLFSLQEGRKGVVVTFIAILELLKQSVIDIVQAEPFGPIHITTVKS